MLTMPVGELLAGRRPLEAEALETIEHALLAADLGLPAVEAALEVLREKSGQIAAQGYAGMRLALKEEITRTLASAPLGEATSTRPRVIFIVGVNGVGKTTTIGKIAHQLKDVGRGVLICAADTFRAAANEQLEIWASRAGCPIHIAAPGADPSAVLTDALRAARARGHDDVLVDTAGRLHTKGNLMAELNKMARVADREVVGAPHETWLVLDATVGSNGLMQGREFARATRITGIILTKLDGTAKGGIAVAVVKELGVPIRYVGVGEGLEDLLPFDAEAFADSLLNETSAAL